MKRLNRRKILSDMNVMREGFLQAIITSMKHDDKNSERAFRAFYTHADISIKNIGGEGRELTI